MPAKKLKEFLDNNHVKYVTIRHSKAYTAREVAQSAHIPGDQFAKTVIVKIDGEMAMAVLPAPHHLEPARLRGALSAADVEIASENEFSGCFPGCETGAMPPFGNLFDMPVYVAESLTHHDQIAFNAGSHSELIKLSYEDFERLAHPTVLAFSTQRPAAETQKHYL